MASLPPRCDPSPDSTMPPLTPPSKEREGGHIIASGHGSGLCSNLDTWLDSSQGGGPGSPLWGMSGVGVKNFFPWCVAGGEWLLSQSFVFVGCTFSDPLATDSRFLLELFFF